MISSLSALTDRLKAATEGSRELDRLIAIELRLGEVEWDDGELWIGRFNEPPQKCPAYTRDLNAAMSLVGDDWWWFGGAGRMSPDEPLYGFVITRAGVLSSDEANWIGEGEHEDKCIAMVIAALMARAAADKEDGR